MKNLRSPNLIYESFKKKKNTNTSLLLKRKDMGKSYITQTGSTRQQLYIKVDFDKISNDKENEQLELYNFLLE